MIENLTKNYSIVMEVLMDCSSLKYIGGYCIILIILSVITNTALIWVFIKHRKKFLHSFNILILALAIIRLLGTIVSLPTVATTAFKCR